MTDAAHDDHIDVVGIGIAGQHFRRVTQDHMALRWRNTVARGQIIEGLPLFVEQPFGGHRREEPGTAAESILLSAEIGQVMSINHLDLGIAGCRQFDGFMQDAVVKAVVVLVVMERVDGRHDLAR